MPHCGLPAPAHLERGEHSYEVCTSLPRTKQHITVKTRDPLFIVGDVHGCADELKLLLEKKPPGAQLVFVGDLVNKGPKNVECVKLAMEHNALCVRGNHELAVMIALDLRRKADSDDARVKIKPGYAWTDGLSDAEIEWIRNLPYTLTFPHYKAIVVHAGMLPDRTLAEQHYNDMTNMRDAIHATNENGFSSKNSGKDWVGLHKPREGSVPCASLWNGPEHMYFGHDAIRKFQEYEFATGLDTGCLYGYDLTAVTLPGGKFESVPALEAYINPFHPKPHPKFGPSASKSSTSTKTAFNPANEDRSALFWWFVGAAIVLALWLNNPDTDK